MSRPNLLPNEVEWEDGELFTGRWPTDPGDCVGLYCQKLPESAEPFILRLERKMEQRKYLRIQEERQKKCDGQLVGDFSDKKRVHVHKTNQDLRKKHGRRRTPSFTYNGDIVNDEEPLLTPYPKVELIMDVLIVPLKLWQTERLCG